MSLTRDAAEEIALKGLAWLATHDDLMPVFMGATGVSVSDLRDRASDPEFLGSVLDFLLMDDAWIMAFCAAEGLANEAPMSARMALPGGDHVHWT